MNKVRREKAFWGALIGSVGSLVGGLINSNNQANAEQIAYNKQVAAQNKQDTIKTAANLSNAYNNQEYIDEFKKKIVNGSSYKMGGSNKYRNKRVKKLSGGNWGFNENNISGALSGISNIIGANFNKPVIREPISSDVIEVNNQGKEELKRPDYMDNNLYTDRLKQMQLYMCGGKKRK